MIEILDLDIKVKEIILEEYPNIEIMSDIDKVNTLREYVYKTVNIACNPNVIIDGAGSNFYSQHVYENIIDFKNNMGGVFCGGISDVLSNIYSIYGFDSVSVDFGIKSISTHVIVLVKVNEKILIQDPYLNISYYSIDGEQYDFKVFMDILEKKKNQCIATPITPKILKTVISDNQNIENSWVYGKETIFINKLSDSRYIYKTITSIKKFNDRFNINLLNYKGLSDQIYSYMYPFAVYGKDSEFKKEILQWVVDFNKRVKYE